MKLKRIGLDTSKAVFTLHGVDQDEKAVLRRNVRRAELETFFAKLPPMMAALEAGAVRTTGVAGLPPLATRCG